LAKFDDLLTSEQFENNPYPIYRQLREEAPVYWSDSWGCWILTRYQDVVATLQDHKRFTSLGRLTATFDLTDDLRERVAPLIRHYSQGLINVDPPDHTRMRNLLNMAFAPRTMRQLEDYVSDIVERLLDDVQDKGAMDIIWDFSYLLPVTVIAHLMGVPQEDHPKFKEWSSRIIEFMTTPKPSPEVLLRSQDNLLALQQFFRDVARERKAEPRDDVITALVTVEQEGERLTEEEMVSTCVTLLIGGHETTTYLVASGMLALLKHPEQMAMLKADPDLITSAVEEMLRWEGPFQRNRRLAVEDVVLNDQQIRKGDLVMQMQGAANRDPAVFDHPEDFDIKRQPNRHVAFGYGPHFCLGAALARMEAPAAINALLRRFQNIDLATDRLTWTNTVFRGLKELPVHFEA